MKLADQLRAECEETLASRAKIAKSRRHANRQTTKEFVRGFLKVGLRAAHEAARDGRRCVDVVLVDAVIRPGAFWINPGILVDNVEAGALQAAKILQRLGIKAEYVRAPVELSHAAEFQPTLALSGR